MSGFRAGKGGFTLIEVLTATVVLTIALTVLYSSFQIGLTAYRRTEVNLTDEREGEVFLFQLTRELRASVPYLKSPFQGGKNFLSFPTSLEHYTPKGITKELWLVEYQLKDGRLIRTERKLKKEKLRQEAPAKETVFERLSTCRFEFLYLASSRQLEWRAEWPNDPYIGLPRGVRLTLSGGVFGRNERVYPILIPHGILLEMGS